MTEYTTCLGCGGALPPKDPHMRGRKRKWCSDHCRKRSHERQIIGRCSDCGAGLSRASGYSRQGTRCLSCLNQGKRRRWETRALIIADLWEDGMTCTAIATEFGWTTERLGVEIARIRRWRPELVPHRRTPEQVERIRAGWARARDRMAA